MAIKYDELKKALSELKDDVQKNMNGTHAMTKPKPNPTTGTSGGEGGMYRSEGSMKKDGMIGQDAMAMSEGVKKDASNPFGGMISTGPKPSAEAVNILSGGVKKSQEGLTFSKNGQWSLNKSAFKDLQHKIERQGKSKESAAAITASIGRKEIGQKEMTARSKAGMNKVDPDENVNIPHPQGKAKMSNGVNKGDDDKLGTNQRLANPPEDECPDPRGRIHMIKEEGTNEKAASSKPHNKGKFKVMDEVAEKESKKAKADGLPYNGDDKKVHKSDKIRVGTGTNDENTGPGRNSGHGAL